MMHDKMVVAANIGAYTVQGFQTRITAGSVVYLYYKIHKYLAKLTLVLVSFD